MSLPQPPEETRRASVKVAVKVINEKGQAIGKAAVTLLPARGKVAAATGSSSAAGVFKTKSPLKAGDYRLRVERADYVKFEDQVEREPSVSQQCMRRLTTEGSLFISLCNNET